MSHRHGAAGSGRGGILNLLEGDFFVAVGETTVTVPEEGIYFIELLGDDHLGCFIEGAAWCPSTEPNVSISPDGQTVRVNGAFVGFGSRILAVALPAGTHRMQVAVEEWQGDTAVELNQVVGEEQLRVRLGSGIEAGTRSTATLPLVVALADSEEDWDPSGCQGCQDWNYGYRDLGLATGAYDPDNDFVEFPGEWWTGEMWDEPHLDGNHVPWTELSQTTGHPNGTNSGDPHWAVRRWTATVSGEVSIEWWLRKHNLGGGNGVTGGVHLNGIPLDAATIAFDDGDGVRRRVIATVSEGDRIDLSLCSLGTDGT